ncbi:c-type cytochrome [Flavobacteriaceae bacterium]|nr:c-type cytochrome [Flavobacteriaceae bacterium]MDB2684437.1 c-type cytochrome [Flavobacteriaceae bacterium]MDB4256635.1 c-type cytochrome [Flavobacteriaceae bacterium]
MKSVYLHKRLTTLLLKSFTFLLLFSLSSSAMAQDAVDVARQKEGRKLYNNLCASCHKLDRKLIGPALAGVTERRENDWLKAWIKNNAALRASGDRDAIAIFNEYNGSVMSAFPQLSDTQIDDILYYTEVGDPKPVLAPGAVASTGGQNEAPGWLIYILAAIIVSAFLIIAALLKTISELKGAPKTPGPLGSLKEVWAGVQQNTFLHVVGVIFLLLTSAYIGFGTLFSVGVDQGYQPVQPIAFSHKIHAGENKVDCQYCHSSAKHSKHSGIPSVNVCMNCHKNIAEVAEGTEVEYNGVILRKNELDKEIQKIYDAAGWDAENLEYTGETNPIKWIRIHNLPDHVNFVHAQHVTVAGVDCKQCHGPVEEMDEMYQYSPLTMGWCIDCHRETNVDLKGNPYYEKIHKQLAEKYGTKEVTIAQLGGLECGKCHH